MQKLLDEVWPQKLKLQKLLSQGGFGAVYLALDGERGSRRKVAVKVFFGHADHTVIRNEILVGHYLSRYDHFPTVLDCKQHRGLHLLIMEYIEGLSLTQVRSLKPESAYKYVRSISSCLEILHSLGIVHHDLKPANFIFNEKSDKGVLIDFGLSSFDLELLKRGRGFENLDAVQIRCVECMMGDHHSKKFGGTRIYMAPEKIFEMKKVGTAGDVWSLGCIFLEVLSGRLPIFKRFKMVIFKECGLQEQKKYILQEYLLNFIIILVALWGTEHTQEALRKMKISMKTPQFVKSKRLCLIKFLTKW